MSFVTEVQTRVSAQLLLELTRQDQPDETTSAAAVLAAASADAVAEFEVETQLDADDTNAEHVAAMVVGIVWFLHEYTGVGSDRAEKYRQRWQGWLSRLAAARGAEMRILPKTSSVKRPSEPLVDEVPYSDVTRWDDYVLGAPGGSRSRDDED